MHTHFSPNLGARTTNCMTFAGKQHVQCEKYANTEVIGINQLLNVIGEDG